MVDFKEKATGMIYHISNPEHLKHFRANPRYEEIKEVSKKSEKNTKKNKNKVEVVEEEIVETTEE